MPLYPKINGVYKEMTDSKVKVNGEWKQVLEILTKENGVWKYAWVSNFIDTSVYHETTSSRETFEDYYTTGKVTSKVTFRGVVLQAFGADGNVLYEYRGTQRNVTSFTQNLYDTSGNEVASIIVTPHASFDKIQYSLYITNTNVIKKLSVSILLIEPST